MSDDDVTCALRHAGQGDPSTPGHGAGPRLASRMATRYIDLNKLEVGPCLFDIAQMPH